VTTRFGLKQAVCHEPHHKQYEIKRKAQEERFEWRAKKEGVDNTDARDDHGIDDPSIGTLLRDADEVTEAREKPKDNHSAAKLPKAEDNRYNFMCSTGMCMCHFAMRQE